MIGIERLEHRVLTVESVERAAEVDARGRLLPLCFRDPVGDLREVSHELD